MLVNSAWEAVSLFDKNSENNRCFDYALKCCAEIGNAIIKQGITSMIWHNFINKKIAALTNLIEKVGYAPKDRLCRKEVGIPETEMVRFIEMTLSLLDLIMDANCNINEVPLFNYDSVNLLICFF